LGEICARETECSDREIIRGFTADAAGSTGEFKEYGF
jgi:hypothetical protein